MKRLQDALRELDASGIVNFKLNEVKTLSVWDEVVGDVISESTSAARIKNGILFVRTKSPAWAQELRALEPEIRGKLNKRIGKKIVREIRFIHNAAGKSADTEKPPPSGAPEIGDIDLLPAERAHIIETAALIKDEDLKKSVMRLMEKDAKLARWKKESKKL